MFRDHRSSRDGPRAEVQARLPLALRRRMVFQEEIPLSAVSECDLGPTEHPAFGFGDSDDAAGCVCLERMRGNVELFGERAEQGRGRRCWFMISALCVSDVLNARRCLDEMDEWRLILRQRQIRRVWISIPDSSHYSSRKEE